MISVFLADDHTIFRDSLRHMLSTTSKYSVVGEASDTSNIMKFIDSQKVDILILDLSMGQSDTFDLIKRLKIHHPELPIVVLSMHDEIQIVRNVLTSGASSYVSKDSDFPILLIAIEKALSGGRYLSPKISEELILSLNKRDVLPHELLTSRELHIFSMLAKGIAINSIAQNLSLSPKTVSSHKARVMQKMNLKTNADIVKYYLQTFLNSAPLPKNSGNDFLASDFYLKQSH